MVAASQMTPPITHLLTHSCPLSTTNHPLTHTFLPPVLAHPSSLPFTRRYASFDYEEGPQRPADLTLLELLVNGKAVDALARLVPTGGHLHVCDVCGGARPCHQ